MGLWLVLFLLEHLLTNSQAALWVGEDGSGFVKMVNSLHNLPYLQVIELGLLAVPFAIHMFWGIRYLMTSKANAYPTKEQNPHLNYGRNKAYTWQRITSWILLVGIVLHVVKFRFIEYPTPVRLGSQVFYLINVTLDKGLYTLADRLQVTLYDEKRIAEEQKSLLENRCSEERVMQATQEVKKQEYDVWKGPFVEYREQEALLLNAAQSYQQRLNWALALKRRKLSGAEVVAVAKDFGTATLLVVRNTFKSPIYVGLYTIFVLAACFHAFNGFWTFLITWGWVLKMAAQRFWICVALSMMAIVTFLGLAAVWGTYWFNLTS
jgi:succinate dehydrogenase / fumarate reductase cytochrome b subunit